MVLSHVSAPIFRVTVLVNNIEIVLPADGTPVDVTRDVVRN